MKHVFALVIAVILGVADRGVAVGGSNHEFCVDDAGADRISCNAEYLTLKAECTSDRAFGRYADFPDAESQYAVCLDEAQTVKLLCRDDIDRCLEE